MFSESENLMAVGCSVHGGGALKIAHFEKSLHVWHYLAA